MNRHIAPDGEPDARPHSVYLTLDTLGLRTWRGCLHGCAVNGCSQRAADDRCERFYFKEFQRSDATGSHDVEIHLCPPHRRVVRDDTECQRRLRRVVNLAAGTRR